MDEFPFVPETGQLSIYQVLLSLSVQPDKPRVSVCLLCHCLLDLCLCLSVNVTWQQKIMVSDLLAQQLASMPFLTELNDPTFKSGRSEQVETLLTIHVVGQHGSLTCSG